MSGAQETELARLERECRQLQEQVSAQAWELSLLRARFARYETALRGSQVTVYTQDSDLRYTSVSNPVFGRAVEDILGRTDAEILKLDGGAAMIAVKREVLASGVYEPHPDTEGAVMVDGVAARTLDLGATFASLQGARWALRFGG